MAQQGSEWQPLPLDQSLVHTAHLAFQRTYENLGSHTTDASSGQSNPLGLKLLGLYFTGAMSALCYICGLQAPARPKYKKLDEWSTTNTPEQMRMLAGLLVFGPTTAFVSNKSKTERPTTSNASALLEFGANVLKHKVNSGNTSVMPHGTLDNLRLYFLKFLCSMGFKRIGDNGLPMVDWKKTHEEFCKCFYIQNLQILFSQDIEIAVSNYHF
jgi:hypothetical protein